jgi:lipopolysaccharide/colanic/teichoic acid biosynthesis glycosyltransferase
LIASRRRALVPKNMMMRQLDGAALEAPSRPDRGHRGAVVASLPMRRVVATSSIYTRTVKPGVDRVAAAAALVVAAIPMAAISVTVAVYLGRPVLFHQTRIGLDGVPFEVLKFRTMRPDRRGQRLDVIHDRRETHKSNEDPRHTRVGRFLRRYSLDELPQLINVLRGEMSIVGPRPELASIVSESYRPGLDQRHFVKPGLTGLWQVSARGDGPMHENGEWDLDYVERVSLRTDLAILAKTPGAMLGDQTGA